MLRLITAALTALVLTTVSAAAQQLSLNQISQYLNSIQSAKSPFTQINGDGTISTGTISIKRPGKVRFEYNPPEQALVLAWSGAVYVFDKKVRGQPETYPLSQTPLSIILERNVNLAQRGMVTGHSYDGTATTVTAQDPRHPEYGSIQMKFTGNPVELRQWIIRDGNGNTTTVVLGGLQKANLPNSLFDVNRVN
ncbi:MULTISPECIES: LolA family protein [Salipiger]|jgi:outer membrane lipoprotein-sorting protein|uniref:Outer membrane lipoprotein-sorting protein n=1 Tax=Salipiger thiooxidans TaxID=282683 RepID=A0A1G7IMF5_9RHOB|nr:MULTISPECIES: outer membrane lipoprotein carrier protein LolA [Salipiger]EEX13626.1 outer membrane lipoprotein carrier protein LolA [Citreicella sp. SE45]MBR9838890.1 outer membrane lipoprotein carrier protein LolA [Paracoccaceae bacterium]MBN8188385.1 outer membrane lipoprotein carrier protein LolA [Salipiger thiooxidans]MCA0850212.1 outer membrane lipoprotein carrier protein LolA [Salipiger thiooxidans]NIY96824.1 outer membrane lipoprotein carrier protein LolA [Salipiger sp. HF18]